MLSKSPTGGNGRTARAREDPGYKMMENEDENINNRPQERMYINMKGTRYTEEKEKRSLRSTADIGDWKKRVGEDASNVEGEAEKDIVGISRE